MSNYLQHFRDGIELFLYLNVIMLMLWPVIFAIEKLDPVHNDLKLDNYWFNWKISLSNCVLGPVFTALAFLTTLSFGSAIGAPFFSYPSLDFNTGVALLDLLIQGAGLFFIACFISDFAYYWWHRLQHKNPTLWELHKLHHSEERMNVTTMPRSHFLEQTGQALFRGLSIGLLFDLSGEGQTLLALVCAGLLPVAWNFLIHSNVRLSELHPLVPFFSTPQYHRVHHSKRPQHQDQNFAVYFPIFDIVFGSYCKPEKHEYPPTGLSSGEHIDTMINAQLGPLRIWWQKLRPNLLAHSREEKAVFAYPRKSKPQG